MRERNPRKSKKHKHEQVVEDEVGKFLTFPRHKIDGIPHTNHQTRHYKILHDDVRRKEISLGGYKIRHHKKEKYAQGYPDSKIPYQPFSTTQYWIFHSETVLVSLDFQTSHQNSPSDFKCFRTVFDYIFVFGVSIFRVSHNIVSF